MSAAEAVVKASIIGKVVCLERQGSDKSLKLRDRLSKERRLIIQEH